MKMKKSMLFGAGIILLAALSGCGGKDGGTAASKDYIYRYEEVPAVSELAESGGTIMAAGDTLYLYGTVWEDDGNSNKLVIAQLDEAGEVIRQTEFPQPDGIYYNSLSASPEGNIFGIKTVFYTGEEAAADPVDIMPLAAVPEAETPTEQYFLVQLGMDGEEIWSVRLNDIKELNDVDYFYVNTMVPLPDSRLLVNVMDKYALFDTAGNYQGLFQISGPGEENIGDGMGSFIALADGRVLVYYYGEKGLTIHKVNMTTGVMGEAVVAMDNSGYSTVSPGAGYDLFLYDSSDLYGYDLGKEPVKLMNFLDSDLTIYGLGGVWGKVPEVFYSTIYDDVEGKNYLARFTKVPPEEVADKIGLTLAASYVDWEVKTQIVKFNKNSSKYRIHLTEYGADTQIYRSSGTPVSDEMTGADRLNADIAAGRTPDILMVTSDLPVKSYVHKGLFADLMPLIEQDEELDAADLLPNVVSAYSVDGHLYQLVPRFSIMTVMAKTALVGSEPGWTIDEVKQLLAGKPEGTKLFDNMLQSTMLNFTMSISGGQFVDWANGKCYFDSDAFIETLEYIKTYPAEYNESDYEDTPAFWSERQSIYRTDKVLAQLWYVNGFRDFNQQQQGAFGEEITMIGFPTESGIGSSLDTNYSFALSARSKNKEGAWEFLRYFLTEEYQDSIDYNLPVSRKALDKMAAEAMKRPYWIDEKGQKVEYDDTYYIDDQEIIIDPIGAGDVEKVKNFIFSVDTVSDYNEDLINIVTEEATPFFTGQKSVREVVDIIQSRAHIYVSENS